ncbi:MAG: AAA family ATPase [Acidobacteriota bacterium]
MYIKSVELENIKSHRKARFEFGPGTTAIVGENGAGKTSILEAVAYTLFDVLDYKKDDFVSRGASKGTVKVSFISSLDEREYIVVRDTAAAYHALDPILGKKIANKKEEVLRFLWQHLGVEPGTDLGALFREAIGVPQGTLTAAFRLPPAQRKQIFDTLLKVEEYRQGADKLKETKNHVVSMVNAIALRIAESEGQLKRYDTVKNDLDIHLAESTKIAEGIAALQQEDARKRKEEAVFAAILKDLSTQAQSLDTAKNLLQAAQLQLKQKQEEAERALAAANVLASSTSDHETHIKTLSLIDGMEKERAERDGLRNSVATLDKKKVAREAELKSLENSLRISEQAAAEIETLKPSALEQDALNAEIRGLRDQVAKAAEKEASISKLDSDILRLRDDYKKNQSDLESANAAATIAEKHEQLSQRDAELTRELTELKTRVDYDEKFQKQIREGLCPILSAKCLNLKDGETLEGFLSDRFDEVKEKIKELEAQKKKISISLTDARKAAATAGALKTLKENEERIKNDGQRLAEIKKQLVTELGDMKSVKDRLGSSEQKLAELKDPRGRMVHLERQVSEMPAIKAAVDERESEIIKLDTERRELMSKLEGFEDFEERRNTLIAERDRTLPAHKDFVANEREAQRLEPLKVEVATASENLHRATAEVSRIESDYARTLSTYDANLHESLENAIVEIDRQMVSKTTMATTKAATVSTLQKELAALDEIRLATRNEYLEKERLERASEMVDFIRETLKAAAPRIARNYVHHVSLDANQIFRDISGNGEHTLKWTEDYGISLEEQGHERPFENLSGGEQMGAAISIRLSLLKQLTDNVRIAFFDEPTTNMDEHRRQRLAEQVGQISASQTFDQLFIISHDDTFEHHVDNIVAVGKD